MNKFYKHLYLQFEREGYETAEKKSKDIYKQQKKDLDIILNKVAKIILSYTIVEEVLQVKGKELKKLKLECGTLINTITSGQYGNEKKVLNDILETVSKDKYYKATYLINIGMDFNLKKLTDKQLKNIVNSTLKSKVWSNRLWDNKKILNKQLKKEINNFLKGKTNVNKIEKNIKNRFNQNAYNTKRLVETEVCRCQNTVNDVFAEEHGVEKQMFTATLDERTSEVCRGCDGKIFDVNDSSKPVPPLHPLCRSCLINMPSDDWKPKVRKNNITKEYIPFMSYEEWKNKI